MASQRSDESPAGTSGASNLTRADLLKRYTHAVDNPLAEHETLDLQGINTKQPFHRTPNVRKTSSKQAGSSQGKRRHIPGDAEKMVFSVGQTDSKPGIRAVEALRVHVQTNGRPGPNEQPFPGSLDVWRKDWIYAASNNGGAQGAIQRMIERPSSEVYEIGACIVWGNVMGDFTTQTQLLKTGVVAQLLVAMAAYPGHKRVQGSCVGAILALALGNTQNMAHIEELGGLRAIKAAMFAYPNMSFAGYFKELNTWLKSSSDNSLELHMMGMLPEDQAGENDFDNDDADSMCSGHSGEGGHPGSAGSVSSMSSSMASGSMASSLSDFSSVTSSLSGLSGLDPAQYAAHFAAAVNGSQSARGSSSHGKHMKRSGGKKVPLGMGDQSPFQLVSSIQRPTTMYKPRKGTHGLRSSLKKAFVWVSEDGLYLCYAYKTSKDGVSLPVPKRQMSTSKIMKLYSGHVTPRLKKKAPVGSESRSMTLLTQDQKTMSLICTSNSDAVRWMQGLAFAAAATHSLTDFRSEERGERLHQMVGAQLPPAVIAAECALDRSLAKIQCRCPVACGGKFCQQAMSQLRQLAAAGAAYAARANLTQRSEAATQRMMQVQLKLQEAKNKDKEGMVGGRNKVNTLAEMEREFFESQEELKSVERELQSVPAPAVCCAPSSTAGGAGGGDLSVNKHNQTLVDQTPREIGGNALSILVENLEAENEQTIMQAVSELQDATSPKDDATIRWRVAVAGAIEPLVRLMDTASQPVAISAARTIAHMARSKAHHHQINSAGALPLLQSLLNYGAFSRDEMGNEAVAAASMALVNLCSGETATRQWVIQCGALESVVKILVSAKSNPKTVSGEAFGNLLAMFRSLVSTNEAVEHGSIQNVVVTVPLLVDIVEEGVSNLGRGGGGESTGGGEGDSKHGSTNGNSNKAGGAIDWGKHYITAAWVLSSLARADGKFQDIIRDRGGLKALLQLMRQSDIKGAAPAVAAIANLVANNTANQKMVREAGALAVLGHILKECDGQGIAKSSNKAMQAMAVVLGEDTRKALKELEATMGALCTHEDQRGVWLRMELKFALAQRMEG